jgi:hypothetical protein
MGKRFIVSTIAVMMAAGLFLLDSTAQARPTVTPMCIQCHAPAENVLRGTFETVSMKAETIQARIGPNAWIVKFDTGTKIVGAEAINKIPRGREIAIATTEKAGTLFATSVSVKQPIKIPEEKLVSVDEMAKLVEMGPKKGNFVLVDSRPAARYHEGHIPGAISIFDGDFDRHKHRLPKEKDTLLIFYCGGFT